MYKLPSQLLQLQLIWRQILCDSCLWQDGQNSGCWAGQVVAFLRGIGYLVGPITAAPLDAQRVDECLRAQYSRVWEGLDQFPRTAAASVTLTTYFRWMYRGDWLDKPTYLYVQLSHRRTHLFIRFKLGCHSAHECRAVAGDPSFAADL